MPSYHFRFRPVQGRGSPKKYWHYLWGYLLPSISKLIKKDLVNGQTQPPVFDSHGPIMDGVLRDYMSILNLEYRVLLPEERISGGQVIEHFASRWDVLQFSMMWPYLKQLPVWPEPSRQQRWRTGVQVLRQRKFQALFSGIASKQLRNDFVELKHVILRAIDQKGQRSNLNSPLLILDRSTTANESSDQNCRFTRKYGTASRSLRGVDITIKKLRVLGHEVDRFEAGAVSQAEQISRFSTARGVIAIRGSDLANMLWLQPGSKLIVLRPQKKLSTHLYGMARLLRLDMHEFTCAEMHPDLMQFPIERHLKTP